MLPALIILIVSLIIFFILRRINDQTINRIGVTVGIAGALAATLVFIFPAPSSQTAISGSESQTTSIALLGLTPTNSLIPSSPTSVPELKATPALELTATPVPEPTATPVSEPNPAPTTTPSLNPQLETSTATVKLDSVCSEPVAQQIEYPTNGETPMLQSGAEYKGQIFSGENQMYKFSGKRGSTVTFLMYQGPGIKSYMEVLDESGNPIAGSSTVHPRWIMFTFIPRFNSSYLLRIKYWGGQGDDYTLRLVTPDDIARLNPKAKCSGKILEKPFAEYIVEGIAGSTMMLTYEQSPSLKASIKIYDLDRNELIGSSSVHPAVTNLPFTPPVSGNYIVRIERWDGSGDYILTLD